MCGNGLTATIPADAAEEVDRIAWSIPATARPGAYQVRMQVSGRDGEILSSNATDITLR
jgi:hypothetical protein